MKLAELSDDDLKLLLKYYQSTPQVQTGGFNPNLPDLIYGLKSNSGVLVGSISLFNITKETAEFGISVFDERCRPLAYLVARHFLKEAFERIKFKKLICKIYKSNQDVLTGAKAAGFFIEQNDDPVVLSMTCEQFIERWGYDAARTDGKQAKRSSIFNA